MMQHSERRERITADADITNCNCRCFASLPSVQEDNSLGVSTREDDPISEIANDNRRSFASLRMTEREGQDDRT
jgi:hypothetical protein